jgi:hypothetical protein
VLILGDIRTCLLPTSQPLSGPAVVDLLSIRPGTRVTATERPIERVVSPASVSGVDCALPTEPRGRARGIGTVATHAVVTGGVVVQGSTRTTLDWVDYTERRAWSHYARRRGMVDVLGDASPSQVARGNQAARREPDTLDLGAVCQRVIDLVLRRPQLDHIVRLRTRPTRLRWNAMAEDGVRPRVHLHLDDDVRRTVVVVVPPLLLGEAVRFCEDLALHDWLYTTLDTVVRDAQRDTTDPVRLLGAALELLVRLWVPGAHVDPALRPLWEELERDPGFSGTWHRNVAWIRDQVSVRTLRAWQEARLG